MCGIVFILSHKPIEENLLAYMRDKLTHRGPDGFGQVIEKTRNGQWVGLAHRRLSIVDLSDNGKQPMENDDGTLIITFNGEIYNYKDIKKELINLGYNFKTQTDTEVLLKAYDEWGTDAIHKLNGMFAFIIWNKREQTVFIARDRFGEKPLYYAHIPSGGIVFASEIKAILAHPEIATEPSETKINSYVNRSADLYHSNLTFYKNIFVFSPSTYSIIDVNTGKKQESQYWDSAEIISNKNDLINSHDVFEKFHYLLNESIRKRLNADVDIGACLSGGLDSSTICSLVGKSGYHMENNFSCFSARFDNDKTISEGYFIDLVLNDYKFQNFSVSPNEDDFLNDLENVYQHQEEPFLSASIFLEHNLYKKIKETGTKVILDGQGADEILAGYHYYFKDLQTDLLGQKEYTSLAKNTFNFNKRLKIEANKYHNVERRFNPNISYSFIDIIKIKINSFLGNKIHTHALDNRIVEGIKYDMLPSQLHAADRNSMAHSIETRFPFLDYDFVDFCLTLDSKFLISNGWTKYPIRESMVNILPDEIRWRSDKVGFAAPQDYWLRNKLKLWAHERLFKGPIVDIPGWNYEYLNNLWNGHQSGSTDYSWALWRWLSLSQWLNTNFGNLKN